MKIRRRRKAKMGRKKAKIGRERRRKRERGRYR